MQASDFDSEGSYSIPRQRRQTGAIPRRPAQTRSLSPMVALGGITVHEVFDLLDEDFHRSWAARSARDALVPFVLLEAHQATARKRDEGPLNEIPIAGEQRERLRR